eukprot:2401160-Pleurochrysis_carterae.AAC.1
MRRPAISAATGSPRLLRCSATSFFRSLRFAAAVACWDRLSFLLSSRLSATAAASEAEVVEAARAVVEDGAREVAVTAAAVGAELVMTGTAAKAQVPREQLAGGGGWWRRWWQTYSSWHSSRKAGLKGGVGTTPSHRPDVSKGE